MNYSYTCLSEVFFTSFSCQKLSFEQVKDSSTDTKHNTTVSCSLQEICHDFNCTSDLKNRSFRCAGANNMNHTRAFLLRVFDLLQTQHVIKHSFIDLYGNTNICFMGYACTVTIRQQFCNIISAWILYYSHWGTML